MPVWQGREVGTEKREGGLFSLFSLVRKGLNGKAIFEQRRKGRKGMSDTDI